MPCPALRRRAAAQAWLGRSADGFARRRQRELSYRRKYPLGLRFQNGPNPLLARVLQDALPVCPRFGAALMDPQTIDLDHGRPLFDPLEKHALRMLNRFQFRIRLDAQPLPERLGYDNPPHFIDPECHTNNDTMCHQKWQSRKAVESKRTPINSTNCAVLIATTCTCVANLQGWCA